ncbi:hypothetical protein [Vibrio algivorus]|uniref:Conjugal transfer protein TraL n=1 Tax=Vibrio algivorus TaxID=1667024 RepID=A0A557PGV8_9VIBR|nr:hypothetical protein [Vibrio algivorus]TVO39890.1 hypothetical protein FOF44_00015 [Vibrio algivorus]
MNRDNLRPIVLTAFTLLSLFITTPSYSASDAECAILICAPVGFLNEHCKDARKAMSKRIRRGKPAAPRFDECSQETPDTGNMEIDEYVANNESSVNPNVEVNRGLGAYIAPNPKACAAYSQIGGSNTSSEICTRWVNVPEQWIKEVSCLKGQKDYQSSPPFCTKTLTYQQVFIDNHPSGHVLFDDGHQGELGGYQDDVGDLILFQTDPTQNLEQQYQHYDDALNNLSSQTQ